MKSILSQVVIYFRKAKLLDLLLCRLWIKLKHMYTIILNNIMSHYNFRISVQNLLVCLQCCVATSDRGKIEKSWSSFTTLVTNNNNILIKYL